MCNYQLEADFQGRVTDDDILAQIDYAIARILPEPAPPYVLVTSAGSFLDDREVAPGVRRAILERLSRAGVRSLTFESRAEFVADRRRLAAIREAFPGELTVGMGLESLNPLIRNGILNKGLHLHTLERAFDSANREGIGFYCYVLLGKPFLTLAEDVQDAADTARFVLNSGGKLAIVEMTNIQPATLTAYLFVEGRFRPPPLWAFLNVLHRIPRPLWNRIPIKGFDKASPMPEVFSENCPKCTSAFRAAYREWNTTREPNIIDRLNSACPCIGRDPNAQAAGLLPLEARIKRELVRVARDLGLRGE
ncbi:MAG: hypothetical protein AAB403_03760 [Planctomycetota bacterium]